jgi:hypothetical protein
MKKPFLCQHPIYIHTTHDGLKLCICSTCAHRWTVVLCPDGSENS